MAIIRNGSNMPKTYVEAMRMIQTESQLVSELDDWGKGYRRGLLFAVKILSGFRKNKEAQLAKANEKNKRLREALETEKMTSRCPCGGWLEGVGVNISRQENIYQCDKCGVQLITPRQALKG